METAAVEAKRDTRTTRRRVVAGLAVLLIIAIVLAGREAAGVVPRFAMWVESLGAVGPLVFMAGYVIGTVAFVPGSLLTLAAGAIFGLLQGTIWVFIGASIGATAAFLVSRYLARAWVEQRLAGNEKFAAVDRAIGRQGLRIVTLLRLSPAFPFNLMNYAMGLTQVRFRDYVLACFGMLPGTLLYVYYGKLAGDVAALAAGMEQERGPAYWALLVVGLIATIAVTTVVTRAARRALREVA
jgi:uncharacterized membrane protein YdjX (TVP38/TMEM64 family)